MILNYIFESLLLTLLFLSCLYLTQIQLSLDVLRSRVNLLLDVHVNKFDGTRCLLLHSLLCTLYIFYSVFKLVNDEVTEPFSVLKALVSRDFAHLVRGPLVNILTSFLLGRSRANSRVNELVKAGAQPTKLLFDLLVAVGVETDVAVIEFHGVVGSATILPALVRV